ncbi:MAG: hypothetical protein LBR15_11075 [Methanobrevibacter sp.]|jgi:hypothetical protein|nr:hypothetical protein [Candidatus Methanovirga australis]
MKLNKIFVFALITILAISSIGTISAATGTLKVEARTQMNDNSGYVIFDSINPTTNKIVEDKIQISRGETLTLGINNNVIRIKFRSKSVEDGRNDGADAIIWKVDKFLEANVDHFIEVHVNFYDKNMYDNIMWIEGGWYEGSKNIYHPTWGSGSSIRALEWNVAGNHWNKFN